VTRRVDELCVRRGVHGSLREFRTAGTWMETVPDESSSGGMGVWVVEAMGSSKPRVCSVSVSCRPVRQQQLFDCSSCHESLLEIGIRCTTPMRRPLESNCLRAIV